MITVRYIGPGEAILAGAYIQQGEMRDVTPTQLADAQRYHPEGFAIEAAEVAIAEALAITPPADGVEDSPPASSEVVPLEQTTPIGTQSTPIARPVLHHRNARKGKGGR